MQTIHRAGALLILSVVVLAGCSKKDTLFAPVSNNTVTGWAVGDRVGGFGLILRSSDKGATWIRQGDPPGVPDADLSAVAAIDPYTAWVVGSPDGGYGTILKTTDGGASWQRQGAAGQIPNTALYKISAVNKDIAWAVGDQGAILHTSDGGAHWVSHSGPDIPAAHFQGVYAADANNVWVTGDSSNGGGYTILRTVDGGLHWSKQHVAAAAGHGYLLGIHAVDGMTAWTLGNGQVISFTSDGGATWVKQTANPPTNYDANEIEAVGRRIGWAAFDYGGVWRTDDGCTWRRQETPGQSHGYHLMGISATSSDEAWAVGVSAFNPRGGIIIHTSDGGVSWQVQPTPSNIGLWMVSFIATVQ